MTTHLHEEAEDFEIHVEDDTPPEDRNRPIAPDDSIDEDESEEEYSERVRKRIAKETAKLHAERRAKELAIRERDEAVQIARNALSNGQALTRKANQYEQGYVYKSRQAAEAMIEKASLDYSEAVSNGDTAKMVEAQRALIRAEHEKAQYETYVPPVDEPIQHNPQPAQAPSTSQVTPDELKRQTKFIQDNPWLNTDQEMTERALQIDAHIRQTNPHLVGSDAYYEFVDTLMRQQFPADRFGKGGNQSAPARQASQTGVAPVNRGGSGNKSPRTVTLTQSQISLCKRLGITPQQYAAQLVKGRN
ncbi:hypothetical protein UFOVP28_32 [uncultured Caudovirales phage]|uniref:Uncharacterized protein n=1 Tax=uncultured Caudovirales phage TaxID=2100421 RepID=A0A6J5KLR6_9CAUD|nr:hypothetical protein UFOVP28_32 [uncultured Caudovirales phage]